MVTGSWIPLEQSLETQLAFTLLYLTQPSLQPHLSLITFLRFMLWSICTTPVHPEQSPDNLPKLSHQHKFSASPPLSMENSVPSKRPDLPPQPDTTTPWSES